jgi:hypothetical protein
MMYGTLAGVGVGAPCPAERSTGAESHSATKMRAKERIRFIGGLAAYSARISRCAGCDGSGGLSRLQLRQYLG